MREKENPGRPGSKKKHGDFSKFIKKKSSPSKFSKKSTQSTSHKTSKIISKRFEEDAKGKFTKRPVEDDNGNYTKRTGEEDFKRKFIKGKLDAASPEKPKIKRPPKTGDNDFDGGLMRLNKYIAHAGVCSRREADHLIVSGAVKVNGVIVTELGSKVNATDKVQIGDQTLSSETHQYVLLNKPKSYITTTDDPENRKTVMVLVEKACKERIYPVGRLDRNTSGLLLFTNDGEMAKKLTHPSGNIKKIYHVQTDQPVRPADLEKIAAGIKLEDGIIKPDAISYVGDGTDRKEIGIELHSGKNRIVRRIFESLDYTVSKLDRVVFAGLTKKDLPRGRWRFLTTEEINILKMIK